jgi:class 3 adenylate cyclase
VHRDFSNLLHSARGDSHLVIVANIDVRGFSAFSERVESVQAALFIRRVYMRLIEEYYASADFYKSTGDGLLVVTHVEENTVLDQMSNAVHTALAIVDDFPSFATDDPLVNFDVPQSVGIGLARGAASRLYAADKTIDYSGRTLNLATRLMDLARPEGIVVDGAFGLDLLDAVITEQFDDDHVFLRSVAEREARPVKVLRDRTVISETARRPLEEARWEEETRNYPTLRHYRDTGPLFRIWLDERPAPGGEIQVSVVHPAVGAGGKRQDGLVTHFSAGQSQWTLEEEAGKPFVLLRVADIVENLRDHGVRLTWGPVRVRVLYQVP